MSRKNRTGEGRAFSKRSLRIVNRLLGATSAAALAVSAAGLITTSSDVLAQQAESALRTFDISSQSLGSAVAAFGRQSGLQVSLAAATASGVRTTPVRGTMEPFTALAQMLSGTGLYWWLSDDGAVIIASAGSATDGSVPGNGTVLERIVVANDTGTGFQGTPDWVYTVPGSVSVISSEAIADAGVRDTNDLFNAVSGVYAGATNGSFPTVAPNIRGLQDSGRVIVSIDGARQNSQDGGRYGGVGTGGISMTFVDTAFVREVDITKKTDASANNAGSLSGAVDFRLVSADDIIQPGKSRGLEVEGGGGTNGYEFAGSAIGAMRFGDVVSVTLGASRKRMGGYEPGENGVADGRFDLTYRRNWSALAKIEAELDTVSASLAWLHQNNAFAYDTTEAGEGSAFDVGTDTIVADIDWTPETPLIEFSGKAWAQTSMIDETREARLSGSSVVSPETFIDKDFTSFGLILDNSSALSTRLGDLNLNYGIEAFRDVAGTAASSSSITDNPLYESSYGSWTPPGRRDIASAFLNGKLDPASWVSISGGLRYDWHRLKGQPTYHDTSQQSVTRYAQAVTNRYDYYVSINHPLLAVAPAAAQALWRSQTGEVVDSTFYTTGAVISTSTVTNVRSETIDIDRSDGAWLPSATIELSPYDWFRPYASYSHSFRPPTISEAFAAGALSPGDRVGTTLAPNLDLAPEKARTYEVGANFLANRIFTEQDTLRIKLSAFYREIDDYIVVGDIVPDSQTTHTYYGFVNLDGTARMRGLELEGNYDTGPFWFGGSLTLLDVDWPQSTDTSGNATVSTTGETIFWNSAIPPRQKLVLNAGVRLFDQRLSMGARMNHVTPTSAAKLDSEGNPIEEYGDAYTTLDVYGSYKVTENALLRFSVNNLTDINYVPANSTYVAPGRTIQASLKLRF